MKTVFRKKRAKSLGFEEAAKFNHLLDTNQALQHGMEQLRQTVSSLRLDSVAAAGFHLSRSQAAELIAHGKAVVNHMPCEKPDRTVTQGDVISIRGLGKLRLELVGGQTKKGRISIEIARYI